MKTIKALDFVDCDGMRIRTYQLVLEDGKAYATVTFADASMVHFAFANHVQPYMIGWKAQVMIMMTKDSL